MNELCRKQALLGQKMTKSTICTYCEKDTKDKNFFKCKTCVNVLHVKTCALKYIGKDSFDQAKDDPHNYICDMCSYSSIENLETDQSDDLIVNLDRLGSLEFNETNATHATNATMI